MRIPTTVSLVLLLVAASFVAQPAQAASSCSMTTDYSGPQTCAFECLQGQHVYVTATPVGEATVAAASATCGGATASCSSSTRTPCSGRSSTFATASATGTCANSGPLGDYADNQITCSAAYDPNPGCPPSALNPNLQACNTPTAGPERTVDVVDPSDPTLQSRRVVGHLDVYTFRAAGVDVNVPCVVLEGGTPADPCDAAGGSFSSRIATLVDRETPSGATVGSIQVNVCPSKLTVLVAGVGIASAAAKTLC